MTFAVCADFFERSTRVDAAVKVNHIMITDTVKSSLAVPAVNVSDGERLAFGGGGAVNYYFVDCSHDCFFLGRIGILCLLGGGD